MKTDEILYELFWQGEEKAADELVLRHGDILTLYINGYLKDMHEAEDLMIESFALMFARKRPVSGAGISLQNGEKSGRQNQKETPYITHRTGNPSF